MGVLLLLIAITSIFILGVSIIYLREKILSKKIKKHDLFIFPISIVHLVIIILSIFWSVNALNYSLQSLITIFSISIIVQTASLILIMSKIQNNKPIFPLVILLVSIIPYFINSSYLHITIPISFLVILMTFLTLADEHQPHITYLIIYASVSLMFYLSYFISTKPTQLLMLVSNTMFLIFFFSFLIYLEKPKKIRHYPKQLQSSPIVVFMKHLVFIIIITNFIFIGTIAVHEIGHAASAKISECEDISIVYEMNGLPHTEINCENTSTKQNWILAGIILPLAISLLLMFGGGVHIKEIALEIIGFNLAISYLDYQALGLSISISAIIMTIGIILSGLGLVLLAKSRAK